MANGRLSKEEKIFIEKEYNKGTGVKSIADVLDRPVNTVLKVINNLNPVTTPPKTETKVNATGRPFVNKYEDEGGFENDKEFDKKVWGKNKPVKREARYERVKSTCVKCSKTEEVKPSVTFNGNHTCNACIAKR